MPAIPRDSTFPFKIFFAPYTTHFPTVYSFFALSIVHTAITRVVAAVMDTYKSSRGDVPRLVLPLLVLGGLVICWTTYPPALMSSNSSDIAAYHLAYRSAVYESLFSGIVYGELPLNLVFFVLGLL